MKASAQDRYFQGDVEDVDKLVPEGIEGRVPYKGPVRRSSTRSSAGPAGDGLLRRAEHRGTQHEGDVSSASRDAGLRESHPHDVTITTESSSYRAD